MRLITAFELAAKKESELDALYSRIAGKLLLAKPETIEHANALGSLENISREIGARKTRAPKL